MRGIFIPDCTQEEIAEILMYARRGANNSMIGIHKHYISVEDTELPRWISVSERLPEQGNQSYLVTVDYGNGLVCSCQRFFFNEDVGWNDDCVIAWQPLPEPYKEEGEEE